MDEQQQQEAAEALRLRYRREARAAVEDAISRTREECLSEVSLHIKGLEDDVRKWKAVAEAASISSGAFEDETGDADTNAAKSTNLIRYMMETVYRDLKKECDTLPNKAEALACMKKSLIISTNKLTERIPTFNLAIKTTEATTERSSHQKQPQQPQPPLKSEHHHQQRHVLLPTGQTLTSVRRPRCLEIHNPVVDHGQPPAPAPPHRVIVQINIAPKSKKNVGLFGKPATMYAVCAQVIPAPQQGNSSRKTLPAEGSDSPLTWKLRRYSDFIEYHTELTKKFPYFLVPNLPPKQNQLSEKDLRTRQSHLVQWLQFVLLHPIIQESPLTKTFLNDTVLNWINAANSEGNGLPADEFLYEGGIDDAIHKVKNVSQSTEAEAAVSHVFNKYTEEARYKCIREMHFIARDFAQLSPNIETTNEAVTTLIDLRREVNKTLSKVAKAFSNLSTAETAPFESSACSEMNKAIAVSLPITESVTELYFMEVCKPLQFLEVDSMKLFKNMLQDVQQRSVDCVKSRKKSEKHLKVHAATVKEWISFRRTRHAMLIEKSLEFAEKMAAESGHLTQHWTATLHSIESLDTSPATSNLEELVAEEKVFLHQCVQDIHEKAKAQALTHATASRVTVPAGCRSRPSMSGRPEYLNGEQNGEQVTCGGCDKESEEQQEQQQRVEGEEEDVLLEPEPEQEGGKKPEKRGSGGGWMPSWFGPSSTKSSVPEETPSTSTSSASASASSTPASDSTSTSVNASTNGCDSSASRGRSSSRPKQKESDQSSLQDHRVDNDDYNNGNDHDGNDEDEREDTPMNRAYKERLKKEMQAAEEEDMRPSTMTSGSLEDTFAKEYLTHTGASAASVSRRRAAQAGGGHQRRLKPTTSHTHSHTGSSHSSSLLRAAAAVTPSAPPLQSTPTSQATVPSSTSGISTYPIASAPSADTKQHVPATEDPPVQLLPANTNSDSNSRSRSRSNASTLAASESRSRRNTSDAPPVAHMPHLPDIDAPQHTHTHTTQGGSQQYQQDPPSVALPEGWEQVVSPEGQIYFYHKLTRITQWERPVEKADAGEEVPPVQGTVQRPGDGPILSKKAEKKKRENEEAKRLEEEQRLLELDNIEIIVKAMIINWTQKPPNSGSGSNPLPKMRTVPELLAALPELLEDGGVVLPEELTAALRALCNVSPPSDIKKCYMKIIRVIHPDKMASSTDVHKKVLTENIFIHLSHQYDLFRKANGL